jgi:hypothetical protein
MIPNPFDGNYGRYLIGWEQGYTRYAHDGVNLPDSVLQKIYFKNAEKLFGITVADWKPSTPVNFQTVAGWQLPEANAPRRRPRLDSTTPAPPM